MKTDRSLFLPLLKREWRALSAHRMLLAGAPVALLVGLAVSSLAGSAQGRLWMLYQLIYYLLPLVALLGTIMLVRQDLREAPLLALLPGSSGARVVAKATISAGYMLGLLVLVLLPSAVLGLELRHSFLLGLGGALVTLVFVSLGAWRGFRARHEVRAYFGGLACWVGLLFGSSAFAYGAHLVLSPAVTPGVTLAALMLNPLEAFRLFVFFGLSAVPMNPHTDSLLALWWMGHPLFWLTLICLPFVLAPLFHAGWNLRLRAHGGD